MTGLKDKLPNSGTTIFTVMSALARENGAINLSQGFPDFEVSADLIRLVKESMQAGNNQYAPMAGVKELREAIAEKMEWCYQVKIDPEQEITITAGGTQAIFTAITTLVHHGDEVILFAPAYDCYAPAIQLSGGKPIYLNLQHPLFQIDWDEVRALITEKTRMILINSPHNPTGMVMKQDDLNELAKIAEEYDLIIISDEVYEHIIFDGRKHLTVLSHPDLRERSLVVGSFGKTFHATGWKAGYALAGEKLMNLFKKVHQYLVFSVNTPVQYGLAQYLQKKENYIGLSGMYQKKRDLFAGLLENSSLQLIPCGGSYFQLISFSAISDAPDVEFARWLTIEKKLAAIPISVFYPDGTDNKLLRFCFAKQDETLIKAAGILKSLT